MIEITPIQGNGTVPLRDMERHELSVLFGDISREDYRELFVDIQINGFVDKTVYMHQDKILDGWHRYSIAKELNLLSELNFVEYEGDPLAFVLSHNLHRRHLSISQRASIVVEASNWLGKGNIAWQKTQSGDSEITEEEVGASINAPVSNSVMADIANVSKPTIERAKQVSLAGRSQEVISGDKTINAIIVEERAKVEAERAKREEVESQLAQVLGRRERIEQRFEENRKEREHLIENPPELPEGQYRTVVIDPPWPMKKIEREVRPNQAGFDYPTMSIEEISAMDIPLADDAFVFLWTTQKFLPSAFQILQAWELTYRFTMVWHKNGGIQPYNCAQFNCEFILVGSKGNPIFTDLKAFNTAFNAPRQEHSVKPDAFYELVDRVTQKPRLDMFSRREIDGFEVWGNEVC